MTFVDETEAQVDNLGESTDDDDCDPTLSLEVDTGSVSASKAEAAAMLMEQRYFESPTGFRQDKAMTSEEALSRSSQARPSRQPTVSHVVRDVFCSNIDAASKSLQAQNANFESTYTIPR